MSKFFKFVVKSGCLLVIFILITFPVNGQTKTNLELFFQLADSAANKLALDINDQKNISVDFVLGKDYQVFQNSILSHFENKVTKNEAGKTSVQFALTEAVANYGEPERKSLFGAFWVNRTIHLEGNYSIISSSSEVKDFSYSVNDEIPFEDLAMVENSSFPFTQGKIPDEPFFSSLLEPAIAVSSAAAAVYIFFTARSK